MTKRIQQETKGTRLPKYVPTCVILLVLVTLYLGAYGQQSNLTTTPRLPIISTESSPQTKAPTSVTVGGSVDDWAYQWLRDEPCRVPCWEGITPGRTSADEAVALLNTNPRIGTVTQDAVPTFGSLGYVGWNWIDGTPGGEALYEATTGNRTIVLIYPYLPVPIQLSKLMQAFGEPSHVIARSEYPPDVEAPAYRRIKLVYVSLGMAAEPSDADKPEIRSDMSIDRVVFFAVPIHEPFVVRGENIVSAQLVPWQGICDFSFYCRDDVEGRACRDESRIK